MELADGGEVQFYEGEKGAERMVRRELASGAVLFFKGERGAERLIRVREGCAIGEVRLYEGEKGAERKVRVELACGTVQLYELASGEVRLYEGEKGGEGKVLLTVEEKAACLRRVDGLMGRSRRLSPAAWTL